MIKVCNKYTISHSQKILAEIRDRIIKRTDDKLIHDIAEHNLTFVYPKIISFSFSGYRSKYKDFEKISINNIEINYNNLYHVDKSIITVNNDHIYSDVYMLFFNLLIDAFCDLNINPIMVIDLRIESFINEPLIRHVIDRLNLSEIILVVLANKTTSKELNNKCNNSCHIYDSFSEFDLFLESSLRKDKFRYTITIEEKLTIDCIENILGNINFDAVKFEKLVVSLDFQQTVKISPFSLALLSCGINTISQEYGVIWDIESLPKLSSAKKTIANSRFLHVNNFCGSKDFSLEIDDDAHNKEFSITLFKGPLAYSLIREYKIFLNKLYLKFPENLGKSYELKYRFEDDLFTSDVVCYTKINYIREIAEELIDNASMHSGGVGYFHSYVKDSFLYIFVGDSGVGLKTGILNNYFLEKEIGTNCDAIKNLFTLDRHRYQRKNDYDIAVGSGQGLKRVLMKILFLKGKFLYRTSDCYGFFMRPLYKNFVPSKVQQSAIEIKGTQFIIIIPIQDEVIGNLPKEAADFLSWEY